MASNLRKTEYRAFPQKGFRVFHGRQGVFSGGISIGGGDIYWILWYFVESVSVKTEKVSHFYPKLLKTHIRTANSQNQPQPAKDKLANPRAHK